MLTLVIVMMYLFNCITYSFIVSYLSEGYLSIIFSSNRLWTHFHWVHICDQVTLIQNGCFSFDYSQTLKAKTGLGRPGAVQEARVRNSTNNSSTAACIVEWKHSEYDLYKQSKIRYQVRGAA